MRHAVVIDAVRTPIGRAHKDRGIFRDVRSDDLATHAIKALIERTGVPVDQVDDVVWGNVMQMGEQGMNMSRNVALMAGLPAETGGTTVNRLCGSSLQALNQAAHAIMSNAEDVQIVGGSEHLGHIPMDAQIDLNPKMFQKTAKASVMMGVTAEFLAMKNGISRQEQDEFAANSHQKAAKATADGSFKKEMLPTWGRDESGEKRLMEADQCVRADCTPESLATLRPAFVPDMGTVTAGNSSPLNDGAAAMLIMSEEKAKELGLKPKVRILATAVAGVDPSVMGIGPVPAVTKALKRAGLKLEDIDIFELNEAFAAQSLSVIKLLGMDPKKVNLRGGAVAIGHPLGCSGARISTTLIHLMEDQGKSLGVATMCIGLGQGIATVFERCDN
jgi:acetyl-CoA acyltransferase